MVGRLTLLVLGGLIVGMITIFLALAFWGDSLIFF
jgi:hypothetical protein